MRLLSAALAAATLAVTATAATAQDDAAPDTIDFTLGGKSVSIPVPDGFCPLPVGPGSDIGQFHDKVDKRNDLVGHFERCEDGAAYVQIKRPKNNMSNVPLPTFLSEMAKVFESDQGKQMVKDVGAEEVEGMTFETQEFGYSGRDDSCVYMSGVLNVNSAGGQVGGPSATCMTAAFGSMFTVNVYDQREQPLTVSQVRDMSRTIALSLAERQ